MSDRSGAAGTAEEALIATLYQHVLSAWNARDARAYAALFDAEAAVIGFDGSQMNGQAEIESVVGQIFADHLTATYVGKVRGVRILRPDVAILRAVVGMVPPGQTDLNPAVNAVQTLVAARQNGTWRIAVFQNTPAQFHGRPEMAAALTDELRQLL